MIQRNESENWEKLRVKENNLNEQKKGKIISKNETFRTTSSI